MIELCNIDSQYESAAIIAVDKLDKVGPDGVLAELSSKGIEEKAREALVTLVTGSLSLEQLEESFSASERGLQRSPT